jgi:hypothetical protein
MVLGFTSTRAALEGGDASGQRVLGYTDKRTERSTPGRAWSCASRRFVLVEGLSARRGEGMLDIGHYVPRVFGSKFRAITRAITPGHPGEVTVTHSR